MVALGKMFFQEELAGEQNVFEDQEDKKKKKPLLHMIMCLP